MQGLNYACETTVGVASSKMQLFLGLFLYRTCTTVCSRRWLATGPIGKANAPIPFSQSKARTFRVVDDTLKVDDKVIKKGSFAVPIGLFSFAVIIYMGFIRKETVADQKAMDYLTQDISDKIPKEKRDALPIDTHMHIK